MTNIDTPWLPEVTFVVVVSEVLEPRVDTLCSFPVDSYKYGIVLKDIMVAKVQDRLTHAELEDISLILGPLVPVFHQAHEHFEPNS